LPLSSGRPFTMVDPPPDIAIRSFPIASVIDSCAVANVLCSAHLVRGAARQGRHFVVSGVVRYECIVKPRSVLKCADRRVMEALRRELELGKNFSQISLTVDDLREVARLTTVKRLGRGELASMVLARKLRQGFMTDDGRARRFAERQFAGLSIRTTSHLAGWLIYVGELVDADIPDIIRDNTELRGPGNIGRYIQACYEHAQMLKLKERDAMHS
jgi:hypothetical protein